MSEALSTEEWIIRAKAKWGDKYDYTNTVYKGAREELTIGCPIHGLKTMKARNHLRSATGCNECSLLKQKENTHRDSLDECIAKFKKRHGERYDYSKVDYQGWDVEVLVICPLHKREFKIKPSHHKEGVRCKECTREEHSRIYKLTGKRVGKLTVLGEVDKEKEGIKKVSRLWWVKCGCGRDPYFLTTELLTRKNPVQACNTCAQRDKDLRKKNESWRKIQGKKFGRLTILRDWGTAKGGRRMALCICECGRTSIAGIPQVVTGHTSSCGCMPKGSDSYKDFESDKDLADRDTILYFVKVKNKYQKIGITYDIENRSRGDYTSIIYEKILPRAYARAIELLALKWTSEFIPDLSKEWKEWGGASELRENLDEDQIIEMLDNLCDEVQEVTWQEYWIKYGLTTGAEPNKLNLS